MTEKKQLDDCSKNLHNLCYIDKTVFIEAKDDRQITYEDCIGKRFIFLQSSIIQ